MEQKYARLFPKSHFGSNMPQFRSVNQLKLILTVLVSLTTASVTYISTASEPSASHFLANQPPSPQGYELQFPSMGTLVTIQAFAPDNQQIEQTLKAAQQEVERLVDIMSDYDPDSELSKLNGSAGSGEWIKVSPELWEILEASDRWHQLSNGAFDASLGSLTRLWRKARRQKTIPKPAEIETALALCGWQHVELDRTEKRVRLKLTGLQLDLGAIAKGYIVDRAFQVLTAAGISSCMVNAGGNLRCGAAPPDRPGWRIEISSVGEGDPPLRRIFMTNSSISTSGDLWQFMLIDGTRRSHILDPRTGWGIAGPVAVTVIANNAQDADAASTSLCVLGRISGVELLKGLPSYEAIFLSRLGNEKSLEETPLTYSATAGFAQGSR
jgi:FAD:protein FMN transferase